MYLTLCEATHSQTQNIDGEGNLQSEKFKFDPSKVTYRERDGGVN